jgi:DNA-directed RNA polymerase subunit RPC12/RpoP
MPKEEYKCDYCGRTFLSYKVHRYCKTSHCSKECYWKSRVGIKFSEEHKIKMRGKTMGGNWKGDGAGNQAMHDWIKKQLGKPQMCEHCGDTSSVKYEWANKDHTYKRKISDYMRLCVKCHRKYDIKYNNYKANK